MNGTYSDRDKADLDASNMLEQIRTDSPYMTLSGWLILTRAAFYCRWHQSFTTETWRTNFPKSVVPDNLTATLQNRVEVRSK